MTIFSELHLEEVAPRFEEIQGRQREADLLHIKTHSIIMFTDAGKRARAAGAAVAVAAAATVRRNVIQSLALDMLTLIDDEEEKELVKLELESELRAKRGRVVSPRPNYAACEGSEILRKLSLKDPASKEAKLFRRHFRVLFAFFPEIVKLVKDGGWSSTTANGKDITGSLCISTELKVRCTRHLI